MADSIADRLRGLLSSDVYTAKGRLRADDLLVRERVARSLAESTGRLRDLAGQWRARRSHSAEKQSRRAGKLTSPWLRSLLFTC